MITNDGGSVFPEVRSEDSDGHVSSVSPDSNRMDAYIVSKGGICLRDWFAGHALAGELASQSNETGEYPSDIQYESLLCRSRMLYRFADAMLAAREKGVK